MFLWTALRAFFRVLFNREIATGVQSLLAGQQPSTPPIPTVAPAPAPVVLPTSQRSEALTLLATLQREARLLDFLNEDLTGFNDAQVGAVVRDIHRDAKKVVERLFAVRPLATESEGSPITVSTDVDAAKIRVLGNVTGTAQGTLLHAGWQATRCEVPAWTGTPAQRLILMPSEVEVRA
jgi:hypothetical protein